ncbi:ExeM/NucH family extracellular endonuclease [Microbacterium sp. AZCO]|uniref:ExeM/NucH family extracellular endonuclease n=1 Tax=Microbacterium sp. AZCO TaxID=3142976 RepID=UPI0031F3CFDF
MHRLVRPSVYLAAGAVVLGALVAAPPATAAEPAPLFLSEVVEGLSNNKAVEVYNPTDAAVPLAGYRLDFFFNGSSSAGLQVPLTGTLASHDVFVLASTLANPAILAQADLTTSQALFNGDDAIALTKDGQILDVFGQIGTDPGSFWGSGNDITQDRTLQRKADSCGDPNGSDAFVPTAQWNILPTDTVSGLGSHTSTCPGTVDPGDPGDPDPVAGCTLAPTPIGAVQGAGDASPVAGSVVRVQGTVVGDFQTGGFDGFFLQDAGDGNPATSDGVFVYRNDADNTPGNGEGALDVSVGDVVSVAGVVSEFQGLTEITANGMEICDTDAALPAPAALTLPATDAQREALESMYVTVPQDLAILEYFEFARYGTIDAGLTRQYQPTATFDAGTPEAAALAAANLVERITIDDGRSLQNPSPALHPNGQPFTLENSFRGGDVLASVTGVLDQRVRSADGQTSYGIQLTKPAGFRVENPRPAVPTVGGDLKVSSFNVLNFFTTIDPTPTNSNDDDYTRGADTVEEFQRQEAKIVAALSAIDADVFGLMEIENNGSTTDPASSAVAELTRALNAKVGGDVYGFVNTGKVGTDAITTAFLYKKATVQPLGDFALLTSAVDPRFIDTLNRPALAQTFGRVSDDAAVTVVVNHLKSKGSACPGDPDAGDGQGNCNGVRTAAAQAITDWLATDPTGQGTGDRSLIIGDLNSYDKEDPIRAFEAAGYTDLLLKYQGEDAYSYDFDGQLGYLDHALAGPGLVADVTGAAPWNINADEPSILDYDMSFKQPLEDALWAPDPYRSSDHDPVIVGIDLPEPDTTAPTLVVTPSESRIFPPNSALRPLTIDVTATDDSGGPVTVELVEATASGAKKAEVVTVSDTSFQVRAVNKAVYTFTYRATDAAGNSTTATAKVVVGPAG